MLASPGSNAGRGLKHVTHIMSMGPHKASPGSNAGRGLKREHPVRDQYPRPRIARQQCRARIETAEMSIDELKRVASPGSNAGRGLKPFASEQPLIDLAHRPAAMPGAD